MGKYLHLFDSVTAFTESYNGNDYLEPWVSYTEENEHVDYNKYVDPRLKEPFTIEITSPGHLVASIYYEPDGESGCQVRNYALEYKKNDGAWTSVTLDRDYGDLGQGFVNTGTYLDLSVTTGDIIQFRSSGSPADQGGGYWAGLTFGRNNSMTMPQQTTAGVKPYGNLMSLVSPTNFEGLTTFGTKPYVFPLFYRCTGLTDASDLMLPATTLAESCYFLMFASCTNLTTAPELPATAFPYTGARCYQSMFNGCSSLNYIKCLASSNLTENTNYWTNGVAATGTFVKDANATWQTGSDGIPTGWTVVNA